MTIVIDEHVLWAAAFRIQELSEEWSRAGYVPACTPAHLYSLLELSDAHTRAVLNELVDRGVLVPRFDTSRRKVWILKRELRSWDRGLGIGVS